MNRLARVEVEPQDEVSLVRVLGEVDLSNAEEIAAAMDGAVRPDTRRLVVDLSSTTYMDSAGVRVLFGLRERLHARRRRLLLVVPKDAPVRAVVELTGLSRIVPLGDSLETVPQDPDSP